MSSIVVIQLIWHLTVFTNKGDKIGPELYPYDSYKTLEACETERKRQSPLLNTAVPGWGIEDNIAVIRKMTCTALELKE